MDWYVPITAITPPSSLLPLSVVSPLPGARQGVGAFGFVFGKVRRCRRRCDLRYASIVKQNLNYVNHHFLSISGEFSLPAGFMQ